MKSDDPSSVSELRARCESDNPLEVYYDVIDAFYFVLEPELPDVLSCLQIVLLRIRKGRDSLLSQAFKLVTSKLVPSAKRSQVQSATVASLVRFLEPFVAEVSVSSSVADELQSLHELGSAWQSAVAVCRQWCGPQVAVPLFRRHNCLAVLLELFAVLVCLEDNEDTDKCVRQCLALVLRCGIGLETVLQHVWTVYTRRRLGLPDDPNAVDDDDDEEATEKRPPELTWALDGVAAFTYFVTRADPAWSLLPTVLRPITLLHLVTFCVPVLIKMTPPPGISVGCETEAVTVSPSHRRAIEVLRRACSCVLPGSNYIFDSSQGAHGPEYALAVEVLSFMVGCPDKATRTFTLQVFELYAATLHTTARFWLLQNVLRACPFDSVSGLLLNMIRRDFMRVFPSPPFHDATILKLVYELLADMKDVTTDGMTDRHELHMGILTLYRAVLLKEKILLKRGDACVTGCWEPLEVQRMQQGYVRKLGDVLQKRAEDKGGDDAEGAGMATFLVQAALEPVVELLGAGWKT